MRLCLTTTNPICTPTKGGALGRPGAGSFPTIDVEGHKFLHQVIVLQVMRVTQNNKIKKIREFVDSGFVKIFFAIFDNYF